MGLAWFECFVVVLSLAVTIGIGLWFSRHGYVSLQEYMLGGRKMTVLPISLSIAATYLSGSAIISTCQEIYLYGMQYAVAPWNYLMLGIISAWVYLPVSYNIKSASCFEFFDRRFNRHIRKFASVIYAVETVLHTAMSQYVPAIALSQATGLPAFPISCVLSLICLAYTASGGLKAVAWADSFQFLVFICCSVAVVVIGTILVGGPLEIWRKGVQGSRMEYFNFDLSPDVRYTIPNLLYGGGIMLANIYLSPSYHQRVASMPSLDAARQVAIWSSVFAATFLFFIALTGIVVYAYFAGCDPVLAKQDIQQYSTILPYFVKQMSKTVPGVEGLFLSGVVAAGLSTTTSCWNTVACTIYEDFLVPVLGTDVPKKTSFRILMGIVFVISVVSTAFILVIQNVSSLQEATLCTKALTFTIHFVLYNAGMFLPWVNSKGVLVGSLASGVLTTYIVLGTQNAKKNKWVRDLPKILTTAECVINGTTYESLNMTTSIGTTGYGLVTLTDPGVSWLFSMSLMLYMVPGPVVGLAVSHLVSLITGPQDLATVDREMIVPMMRWVLPPSNKLDPINEEDAAAPLQNYVQVPLNDLEY